MAGECVALNYLTMVSSTAGSGECSFLKKKRCLFLSLVAAGLGGGPWGLRCLVWDLCCSAWALFSAQTQYL